MSVVSRSRGAMARDDGSALRILAARRERRMGPNVSGRKAMRTRVRPASMRPIQKHQRQPMVGDVYPETMGERIGPRVVALSQPLALRLIGSRT